MILPGQKLILQKIIQNVRSTKLQAQPCGVDLTLKRILIWKSSGEVDFDNSRRNNAQTEALPFQSDSSAEKSSESGFIDLTQGSYLVEFNETVNVPVDVMGQIFVRSSLFRSGAIVNAGVMDSGYIGAVGCMLQIVNPHGLRLWKDARLAQMVFHQMSEPTEGYSGTYQGRQAM
jgi:dUTP pyrophosphatase